MQEDDVQKAEASFMAEIDEHPKNGYAYLYLATVQLNNEEYGSALSSINNAIKYIPKKDKSFYSFAYYKRAGVYNMLDKSDLALEDLATAISIYPKDEDYFWYRGEIYYQQEKYDLSDKDFRSILELDESSGLAYMGLGRNEIARKNYQSAIERFDYVAAMYSEYSSAYSFRAEAYIGLKKYREAAEDIVQALCIDHNSKAFSLMQKVADSSFVQMNAKLKAMSVNEPNDGYWPYCIAVINESTYRYEDAITNYTKANKLNESAFIYSRISQCYQMMGEWSLAVENVDKAIIMDPREYSYIMDKADIYYEAGQIETAIEQMGDYIELEPDWFGGYYKRGWYKDNIQNVDGAIEDYSMAIELQPDYAYAMVSRGNMYLLKGEKELAMKDFETVVQIDTIPEDGSCTMYALMHLGRTDEAIAWMDKMLASGEDEGIRYEAACLYSLMGDVEKSLEYLEESLKRGNKSYHHILTDDDLNNTRESEKFNDLIKKYFPEKSGEIEQQEELVEYVERVVEVPFSRAGGVTKVKCEINGLPLHFIFDTGAADVTISAVEATFMFKNEYLTKNDVVGSAAYMDANGDISVGTVLNLKKVTFGGLELTNVRASVVNGDKAPLLLGQTVLNRLGKIEIDYDRSVLKITSKERKQL